MNTPADICIALNLPDEESQALAQLVKRVSWIAMRECAVDEAALTENERAKSLKDAGWKAGGSWTPSAADAWVTHKKRLGLERRIER